MNKKLIEAALKSLEMGNNVQISKTECRRLWSYAKAQGYEQNDSEAPTLFKGVLKGDEFDEVDTWLEFKEISEKRMQVTSVVDTWVPVESTQEGPPWSKES